MLYIWDHLFDLGPCRPYVVATIFCWFDSLSFFHVGCPRFSAIIDKAFCTEMLFRDLLFDFTLCSRATNCLWYITGVLFGFGFPGAVFIVER